MIGRSWRRSPQPRRRGLPRGVRAVGGGRGIRDRPPCRGVRAAHGGARHRRDRRRARRRTADLARWRTDAARRGGRQPAGVVPPAGLVPRPAVAALAFCAVGLAVSVIKVVVVSLAQRLTADALLGRVNATYRLLGLGTMPLGALLGGALGSVAGLPAVFLTTAGLCALAVVVSATQITAAPIAEMEPPSRRRPQGHDRRANAGLGQRASGCSVRWERSLPHLMTEASSRPSSAPLGTSTVRPRAWVLASAKVTFHRTVERLVPRLVGLRGRTTRRRRAT
jgi:hypothetical protein